MRADTIFRIAIVGASSLAGKELSDALGESSFAASSFTLLDEDEANGQLATAGDEVSFIQKIVTSSFEGMDLVFFAGDGPVAVKHWQAARKAGAGIVDLTSALHGYEGVPVRSPWVSGSKAAGGIAELNLETAAVVSAHPAAVMLALVAARIANKFAVKSLAATVLEPASQYGRPAMDELHQQTVSLLSFQTVPRVQYDAQAAFNLLPAMGEEAKVKLGETERRIATQYAGLAAGLPELALQLIHAPVFHGYVVSMFVELEKGASLEEVELSLVGDHIDLVTSESEPPSNLSAAGQEEIMARVESAGKGDGRGTRFKVLLAADNLKLAAASAIACARELVQLRPSGKIQ
jgi:aspartate-semialdehyde dehydrogenase